MKNESVFHFAIDASTTVDALMDGLAVAGHSKTRARRAVLEVLQGARQPLNPGEILEAGRRRHPALGLVTVYRTLELLQGLRLITRLHLQDGCHSYVLSPSGGSSEAHGHHIICEACGRAVAFEGCDIGAIVTAVEGRTGFKVRTHWLELFGLCLACRTKERV